MGDLSADPRAPESQRSCLDVIREVVEERVFRMQFKIPQRLALKTVDGCNTRSRANETLLTMKSKLPLQLSGNDYSTCEICSL